MHITTESKLNSTIVRKIPKMFEETKPMWLRVENYLGSGTFDTWTGMLAFGGWIELKVCGPNAKPDMRDGQPAFGYRCKAAHVPAHVLCCSKDGYIKLLNGWTTGPDWRDHMVMEADLGDNDSLRMLLITCLGIKNS